MHRFSDKEMIEFDNILESFYIKRGICADVDYVDVFEMATQELKFSVSLSKLENDIDGVIMVDESKLRIGTYETNKVILLNNERGFYKNRETLSHELAHFIDETMSKGDKEHLIFAQRESSSGRSVDENKMDYIGAAILMPKRSVKIFFEKIMKENISLEKIIDKLMEKYDVSNIMAIRRIIELKLVSHGK